MLAERSLSCGIVSHPSAWTARETKETCGCKHRPIGEERETCTWSFTTLMHLYLCLGRATSPRRNCRSSAKNTSRRPRWAGENSRSNHCMMELYQSTPSNSITASVYPSPYARRPVQWIILVTQLAIQVFITDQSRDDELACAPRSIDTYVNRLEQHGSRKVAADLHRQQTFQIWIDRSQSLQWC
jgi:hypothetical protein